MENSVILGIDPGSRITGYGVIQVTGNRHTYVASGCIRTQGTEMAPRLQQIFKNLSELMETYQPHEVAIEQVFMHKNASSALKLGQARGAAIVAAGDRLLFEYSARQVKQAVVGYGAAEKSQVQLMIRTLLNLSGLPQVDAADALAIAVCHAQARYLRGLIK